MGGLSRRAFLVLGPLGAVGATAGAYYGLKIGQVDDRTRATKRRRQADKAYETGKKALGNKRLDAAGDRLERAEELYERTQTLAKSVGCETLAEYASIREQQAGHLISAVASWSIAANLRSSTSGSQQAQTKIRRNEREARNAQQKAQQLQSELPSSTDCE